LKENLRNEVAGGIAIKVHQSESCRAKAGNWKMEISALSYSRIYHFS